MRPTALTVLLATMVLAACATSQPAPQPSPSALGTNAGGPPLSATLDAAPAPIPAPTPALTPTPTPTTSASVAPPAAASSEVDAKYRACTAAADCVAVEPVGCCHTGRMVAVAAAQKDAYLASFVCTDRRPICPMIRFPPDGRVPACEGGLCILKTP